MKKVLILLGAALLTLSCSKWMNDLVHEEVPAYIEAFELEGQVSATISRAQNTVTVVVPEGADLTKQKIKTLAITEGAVCNPSLEVGMVLDMSSDITVTLTTFDAYTWTLKAQVSQPAPPDPPKEGPQLYNMSFDHWCMAKDNLLGTSYDALYDADATEAEKAVWGSASASTEMLGYHTVIKEETFLAQSGANKRALKLQTQGVEALFGLVKKLAAGSVFNGKTGDIEISKMSAQIYWGVPFTDRPKALEGFYCYKPVPIDWVQDDYKQLKGQLDKGSVAIILADWDEPFMVCAPDQLLDPETNPGIIGYGKILFDKEMTAYESFHLDITYRNERTPKYIAIVCSSSYMGDYFTGGSGSVLYLDEFKLTY